MMKNLEYTIARDLLIKKIKTVNTEYVTLSESMGRILAEELKAKEMVPSFDKSSYDGYAFRSEDVKNASEQFPVTLKVLEEIPAGSVSNKVISSGTAVKILTGAPIPVGADAVCKYEDSVYTSSSVSLLCPYKQGSNIVKAGEDISYGTLFAKTGDTIDVGIVGTMASQGIHHVMVYRKPQIGIISTGNEILDVEETLVKGKIRNTNRYTLEAAIKREGMIPVYLGICRDSIEDIQTCLESGVNSCDAVIITGGASVGDYDFTSQAMEKAGIAILFQNIKMKPGMACVYGLKGNCLVCGLSGNPASAITNFYCVALPALKYLAGRNDYSSKQIEITLQNGFPKSSPYTRFLRGTLDLSSGKAVILLPKGQGNTVLSSMIGCDVMAVVPAGSGPLESGTKLKGFRI